MASTESQRRYIERLRKRLADARGNRCERCGATPEEEELQWAHVKPTALRGSGRGREARLMDIKNNPDSYKLFCKPCHKDHDEMGPPPTIPGVLTEEEIPF